MPVCGVNLRQEDVASFKAACGQAGVDPGSIPVLAILHDDTPTLMSISLSAFVGLTVAVYRCMTPNSQLPLIAPTDGGLPAGAHIIGWNEADESQSWWDQWWQDVRAKRADLIIHYGAPNVDGQWPLNLPLLAQLDVQDAHIGSTFSPPARANAKPAWVTEIDIDPNRFSVTGGPYPWGSPADMTAAYAELLACMERCLTAGMPAFAWGIQSYAPEAAYDPTTVAAISALNTKYAGETNVAVDPTIQQVLAQNALIAQALYDMVRTLNGGQTQAERDACVQDAKTQINALDPARFTF
jgi:hypothetical protein